MANSGKKKDIADLDEPEAGEEITQNDISKLFGNSLYYKNNVLYIGGLKYSELLENRKTPLFVFIKDRMLENYKAIKDAFEKRFKDVKIAYAAKANNSIYVLKECAAEGMMCEVMSKMEHEIANISGFKNSNIIFNGPAKTDEEIKRCILGGVFSINVDSFSELKRIETISQKAGLKTKISIRVHPDLPENIERKALVKKNSKLGTDYNMAKRMYLYAKKSDFIEIEGIHCHVGTQQTDTELLNAVCKSISGFVNDLEKEGIPLKKINIGGGYASRYLIGREGNTIDDFAEAAKRGLSAIKHDYTLILEPGRYIVGDAFVALSRITRVKKSFGRSWAFADIGANTLVPLRYSKFEVIPSVFLKEGKAENINIAGPLCLPVDIIQMNAKIRGIEEGYVVAVLNCGAYTLSMSEQFGYPRPEVVAVSGGKIKTIRKAETLEDVLRFESY